MKTTNKLWILWGVLSLILSTAIGFGIVFSKLHDKDDKLQMAAREMFSPGSMTPGHQQIAGQCTSCHGDKPFEAAVTNEACSTCHARNDDNKAESTHPKAKFEDPANAERLNVIAADKCTTCHAEHQPGSNPHVGVTQPKDFCVACHKDVAKDTPSHQDMAFDTCTNAGCHSYHDNRATYRKLLKKNIGKGVPESAMVLVRDFGSRFEELGVKENPHGTGKVGECKTCHAEETASFELGKHGVRTAAGLSPMSPKLSKLSNLSFTKEAHSKDLTCTSCHEADKPNVKTAAVEACMSCHNDEHTRNYEKSKHAELWKKEVKGELPAGSGVSCATCHMPRMEGSTADGNTRVIVSHNNTGNLRPAIKQAKVCTTCHSLQFTHDALAEKGLGKDNFLHKPSTRVKSIDMEAARK